MRLEAFSVRDYRSIRKAARIPLRSGVTVLLGPNNEGKTNLLKALVLAMSTIDAVSQPQASMQVRRSPGADGRMVFRLLRRARPGLTRGYDWAQDYPRDLQEARPDGETVIRLTFALGQEECAAFHEATNHRINGTLPIEFSFGVREIGFRVPKRRWAAELSRSLAPITRFVSDRVRLAYIPAVRTHENAARVIDVALAGRLAVLEDNEDYRRAMETVRSLQTPILEQVSREMTAALRDFLPAVKSVNVRQVPLQRYERPRDHIEIVVDDGVATPLSSKGDGVISLAAIGLMRRAAGGGRTRQGILAIEEPEAHLHPQAIHLLRDVLHELATTHQVILTSHSPLFVERRVPAANVLVQRNTAKPAPSLREIRAALGVKVHDNLYHADAVLLVEGPHDKRAIEALLAYHRPSLAAALQDGRLAIEVLGGCSKLQPSVYALERSVVDWLCLLDYDAPAKRCFQQLIDDRMARNTQVVFTTLGKLREAEIEDWYRLECYASAIDEEYGAVLSAPKFVQTRGKWSSRAEEAFRSQGLDWEAAEAKVKGIVADSVASTPADALRREAMDPFAALMTKIEDRLVQ